MVIDPEKFKTMDKVVLILITIVVAIIVLTGK